MKLFVKTYAAVLGGFAVGALTTANAQLRNEAQFAVGASYEMPAGDFSTGTGAPVRETPRHKEAGEHRLRELKAHAGSPADRGATLPEAGTVQQSSGRSVVTGASVRCTTNKATDYTPSDIHGAVGLTNLVTVTNVDIGVYRKSDCMLISRVSLTTVFKAAFNIPSTQTLFDARVLYDPSVDRFLVIADSDDSNNTDQYQYFAVSQDGTGTSWYVYSFILSQGTSAFCKNDISDFWDYPSAGSSSTRWFITANDFGNVDVTGAILSIDKIASLNLSKTPNNTVPITCFNGLPSNVAPPIVTDGNPTAYFLSPGGSGSGNAIVSYALTASATGPSDDTLSSPVSIAIPSWSAAPQAAQPNGQRLDTLDGRFQSASVQTGASLWNVHTINIRSGFSSFARWRLYRISTAADTAAVLATPTTSDCSNCDHLFNPSVAVNSGTAFVTASRTMPSKGSAGYAAMLVFAGPNSSTWTGSNSAFNRIMISGTQFVTDGFGRRCNQTDIRACRWGDYSATQIDPDPFKPASAWGFNQLVTGTTQFNWTTNAAQVQYR